MAYQAQLAASRHLPLHHLAFRVQHQRWWRLHRDHSLVVALDINTDGQRIGLFAELVWVLYALLYIETIGGLPRISVTSSVYSLEGDGKTDYLPQYFRTSWSRLPEMRAWTLKKRLSSLAQLPRFEARTQALSLWKANALVSQHLTVNADIEADVSRFIAQQLDSDFLAVHWRGTDKYLEASPVTADSVVSTIVSVYESLSSKPAHLFIATDQQELLLLLRDRLAQRLPSLQCVARMDAMRSTDGQPMHLRNDHTPGQRYLMGREALIDSMIMSRAKFLIRTASFLSAWCSILNPTLPVIMVNAPCSSRCWFPDSEIVHASRYYHLRTIKA